MYGIDILGNGMVLDELLDVVEAHLYLVLIKCTLKKNRIIHKNQVIVKQFSLNSTYNLDEEYNVDKG